MQSIDLIALVFLFIV